MAPANDDAVRLRLEAELAQVRERYAALRRRKAVRAALAVAKLRLRLLRRDADADAEPPPSPTAAVAAAIPTPAPAAPSNPHPEPAAQPEPESAAQPEPESAAQPDAMPDPTPQAVPALAAAVAAEQQIAHCWPLGHFYSPVPDTTALQREPTRSRVWPDAPADTPGIDWRDDAQVALVRELAAQDELVFADAPTGDPTEYHTANEMFSRLDAWALQGILRRFRPLRMIEVGSGWSSLVAARVNRERLGRAIDLTCIEPYPADFLEPGVPGISRLLRVPIQEVPLSAFAELQRDDVLFIDSSHVAKTGSDCNHLYQEVLPRLRSGVIVHIHDIFLPFDYPEDWVLSGRGWNEQYVLRALLTFSDAFEILLGNVWMSHRHPEVLAEAVPGFPESAPGGGGSIWLRRT